MLKVLILIVLLAAIIHLGVCQIDICNMIRAFWPKHANVRHYTFQYFSIGKP